MQWASTGNRHLSRWLWRGGNPTEESPPLPDRSSRRLLLRSRDDRLVLRVQRDRDPFGGSAVVDPGARIHIAITDCQSQLVAGTIKLFSAGPEFHEIHGAHSIVSRAPAQWREPWGGVDNFRTVAACRKLEVPNPCLFGPSPPGNFRWELPRRPNSPYHGRLGARKVAGTGNPPTAVGTDVLPAGGSPRGAFFDRRWCNARCFLPWRD
jgi:hypothetical protein